MTFAAYRLPDPTRPCTLQYTLLLLSSLGVQGVNPVTKKLEISTTPNQDPLLNTLPIIGVDIWEHAFYLQYKNVKADVRVVLFLYFYQISTSFFLEQYLTAIWNVINFDEAAARYEAAVTSGADAAKL